jgi:hypothetical protein
MTVLDNVVTACHRHSKQGLVDAVFRLRYFKDEREHRDFALELLQIFRLEIQDEAAPACRTAMAAARMCACWQRGLSCYYDGPLRYESLRTRGPHQPDQRGRDKFNLTIVSSKGHEGRDGRAGRTRSSIAQSIALGLPAEVKTIQSDEAYPETRGSRFRFKSEQSDANRHSQITDFQHAYTREPFSRLRHRGFNGR